MFWKSTTLARQLSVLSVVALFGSGVHANDRVLEYEVIIASIISYSSWGITGSIFRFDSMCYNS